MRLAGMAGCISVPTKLLPPLSLLELSPPANWVLLLSGIWWVCSLNLLLIITATVGTWVTPTCSMFLDGRVITATPAWHEGRFSVELGGVFASGAGWLEAVAPATQGGVLELVVVAKPEVLPTNWTLDELPVVWKTGSVPAAGCCWASDRILAALALAHAATLLACWGIGATV